MTLVSCTVTYGVGFGFPIVALIAVMPSWQLRHAREVPSGVVPVTASIVGLVYIWKAWDEVACAHSGTIWLGSVLWAAWQGEQTPRRLFHDRLFVPEKSWGEPSIPMLTAACTSVGNARARQMTRRLDLFILFSGWCGVH